MSDNNSEYQWITEDKLREIVQTAAHEAAKSVNLSAQLASINSRLHALEDQNTAFGKALTDHMKSEPHEISMAVADGIERGFSRVQLDDKHAGKDIKELRDLLGAWRDVKGAVWSKLKHIIAVAILGGIAWAVSVFTNFNPLK